ncbi:MAG: HAD family hydrolase [Planctomycetota bacterium]
MPQTTPQPKLIAMWSGPRNISTAMMRSWEARGDTMVVDEPLYAHYLLQTRINHPGAQDIIAAGETDLELITTQLTSPPPAGCDIMYQKHMAHHLLPGMDRGWVDGLANALLVRQPREMLTSLIQVLPNPDVHATGLPAQVELLDRFGGALPVVESRMVLANPPGMLRALCGALGVEYCDRMLSWEPGLRETDGVWAPHWYANVEQSTGFAPYAPKNTEVPGRHLTLLRECEALYERLIEHALAPIECGAQRRETPRAPA